MSIKRYIGFFTLVFVFCQASLSSYSQLGLSFDIPKPKQYEERTLRSEKSDQKKFTVPRRFIQNTTTHYNYFYNANIKLNEIIERAKEAHKDDYTELLSFYNYDLDATVKDSIQLDSVIYKATSGIVLHDLRSDWADNMYLLWGAAHYLQKEFDSAYLTFQFINYAFAPKEKDGYYQFIGSGRDGNSAMSIATNEKTTFVKKLFNRPPSRNEAFIWQIRTFLAWGQMPEAASLIETLKNDPLFPSRLQNDLEEVQALYFYNQEAWDSAAAHLVNALSNATNKNERARWEFLAGQMYELAHKYDLAKHYYQRSIGHTVDPVMDIYARLNSIRCDKTGGDNFIEKNIEELLKMAKRDKYTDYRDIIYYMAAQMELERNNLDGAAKLLLKATKYDNGNISQRNKAYLKLADLSYQQKKYEPAYNFYDSIRIDDPQLKDTATIMSRKALLKKIVMQTAILERQDSLQRIADMPEDQRKDFVKKIVKELRKTAGLETEEKLTGGNPLAGGGTDIFSSSQSSKGEWYFYNTALRTKGASDFKAKWGNRPNVDNWRRLQAVATQGRPTGRPGDNSARTGIAPVKPTELTFDALYANLPLTDAQKKIAADSIQNAMFELGKVYAEDMEDCSLVIPLYEDLVNKYPQFPKMDQVLFQLYHCYSKDGNTAKLEQIKAQMKAKYPMSKYTGVVVTGKDLLSSGPSNEATARYSAIYDLFLEGKFDEAATQKKKADSIYGENFWSPQLMYIESVYYIKQRNDSIAIDLLTKLKTKYPATPLAAKAITMIDVLKRRAAIEEELDKYQIQQQKDETRKDTTAIVRSVTGPVTRIPVQDSSTVKKNNNNNNPATGNQPPVGKTGIDSAAKKSNLPSIYSFNAAAPHYVMIILNKVDVVFGNEAKNAFFRYNRDKYYNKTYELSTVEIDGENKILLIKPFDNVQAATDYALEAKRVAATEIVPWLKADKYSFSIISEKNLDILKANPDLSAYKRFLDQNLPGKF